MLKLRNVAFDLGGVIIHLDCPEAVRRFKQLGLARAEEHLDSFVQRGIFGQLEDGSIGPEDFRRELSRIIGRDITAEECAWAIHGYVKSVDGEALRTVMRLRAEGYQVCLLSNTNPFMAAWADSPAFTPEGQPLSHFFDRLYLSYEQKAMKPGEEIYRKMLEGQQAQPGETLFIDDSPANLETARRLGIGTLLADDGGEWMQKLLIATQKQS